METAACDQDHVSRAAGQRRSDLKGMNCQQSQEWGNEQTSKHLHVVACGRCVAIR